MNSYEVKYRKTGATTWETALVLGHKYESEFNKMSLFMADGTQLILAEWSKYDMFLGLDFMAMRKQN